MTTSKWWWYSPYIISDKGNDLIPGAKAYYDASAAIRKALTFSLDTRRLFVNISLDYKEGLKRLLPEEILEVLSKRTNDLPVVSSFQKGIRPQKRIIFLEALEEENFQMIENL